MSKFYGNVGFSETVETPAGSGIWKKITIPKPYKGDFLQNYVRSEQGIGLNDDLTVSNRISIIADRYARHNFHSIKYVEYLGTKWKVTNVEDQRPRLILSLGGMYHGDKA
jgi:hypothetical protein